MYIETWQQIERQKSEVVESRLRIESTPATRKILKTEVAGEERIRHTERLREFNELFEIIGEAEWKIYKRKELPEQVIAILEAVSSPRTMIGAWFQAAKDHDHDTQ